MPPRWASQPGVPLQSKESASRSSDGGGRSCARDAFREEDERRWEDPFARANDPFGTFSVARELARFSSMPAGTQSHMTPYDIT
jgi:hypothetical protein